MVGMRSSTAAFTLVEILIAMGILGLVLTAIFTTWTSILRASRVAQESTAAVQRARIAGHVLEESLNSTVCFVASQRYYTFLAENGSAPLLEFTARLPKSFPRSGRYGDFEVRRLQFSLQPGPDNDRQLVLRQTPLLREMDEDEQNFPLVLAKNVKEFKTEFWDARKQEWLDEWKTTNQLPPLVKVTLKLTDNARASVVRKEMCRIVALPSVAVQPPWQTQGGPGAPPGQPPPAMNMTPSRSIRQGP